MRSFIYSGSIPYILLSILHLIAVLFDQSDIQFYTKPLLLTALAWYFFRATGLKTRLALMVFIGFIFSVFGDTFLMFVPKGEKFFLFGLGSFLLAHLCYIIGFMRVPSEKKGLILSKPWYAIPFIGYLAAMLYVLMDAMPVTMRYPVVFYSYIIMMMALAATNLQPKIRINSFILLLTGALLFMISDSMIAFNKFTPEMVQGLPIHFLIMLTYLIGQFLIAYSCIKIHKEITAQVA
jgi:uncharacterized membrane protein YhhN